MNGKHLNALLRTIRKAGIDLHYGVPASAPAAVRMDEDGRYHIHLDPDITDPDALTSLLVHELGHVMGGDLLVTKTDGIDPLVWNVAADARINTPRIVEPIEKVTEVKGVLYERIRKEDWPEKFDATPKVYERLKKKKEDDECQGCESFDAHINECEDQGKARKGHASTVIKLRKALKEADIPQEVRDGIGDFTVKSCARIEYQPDVAIPQGIEEILKHIEGFTGVPEFRRTWRRPGLTKSTRGAAYLPAKNIVLLVDVSGSMATMMPYLASLQRELALRYHVVTIAHDTHVIHDDDVDGALSAEAWPWGGGTAFRDAYERAMTKRPDVIVHLTDLYTHDLDAMDVRTPVVVGVVDGPDDLPPLPANVKVVKCQ